MNPSTSIRLRSLQALRTRKYIPKEIEEKWQKKWQDSWKKSGIYRFKDGKNKYYNLVEFPYPSGDLHLGHWFTFSPADAHARYKRMKGFSVFFPNGFDAFGLPAENAAIKKGVHPRDWTLSNIETMIKQYGTMGTMIDWNYKVITCDPGYYKWNQWIFIKMFERGLSYRGKAFSNWCPSCQTVLANENIEGGSCWRCGTEVIQKEIEQWFLKITDYAEDLLWPQNPSVEWPKSVRDGQNNWIGRKEGISIVYKIVKSKYKIDCWTSRPDTNFGATFIVLAPEHPQVLKLTTNDHKKDVEKYIKISKKTSLLDRTVQGRQKTGAFTGSYAINDLTGERMPIWVSDFVLMGFGTGAVVGVPGHDKRDFEFAKKFGLPIKRVVVGKDEDTSPITRIEQVQEEEGIMINSGFLDGLDIHEATRKVMDYIEKKGWGKRKTTYHLRDWSVSRQRYWGTPVPIIYCRKCWEIKNQRSKIKSEYGRDYIIIDKKEYVINAVPLKDLPVELPYEVDYAPKGKPPLASATDWMKVRCPKCNGEAQRDPETLDTFFDSAWYFFRYVDPKNSKEIFLKEKARKLLPVDVYFGGAEHTLGHTLYARFFTRFFKDIGLTNLTEFAKKRIQHGVILGPDGYRMSKSRGNVVNPDDLVAEYGADTVRTYLCFMMPYGATAPFSVGGISGVYRFLRRIWELQEKVSKEEKVSKVSKEDHIEMNKAIKKVGEDLENFHFNTAISTLMTWLNYLSRRERISKLEYENFIKLLAPFSPHISEELYQLLGNKTSIHLQKWPEVDQKFLKSEKTNIAVQVNGKLRGTLQVSSGQAGDKSYIEERAKELPNVRKYLDGKKVEKVIYVQGKVINFVAI